MKRLSWAETTNLAILAWMIYALAVSIMDANILNILAALVGIAFTLTPFIVSWKLKRTLKWYYYLGSSLPTLANLSGEFYRLYYIIPVYDKLLHLTISAMGAFFVMLFLQHILSDSDLITRKFGLVLILTLLITIGFGTLWEIYEYAVDVTFQTEMQGGLVDTMQDLIFDLVGAGITAVGVLVASHSDYYLDETNKVA